MSRPVILDGVTLQAGFGVANIDEVRSLSGFDYLQGICEGRFPAPTICKALNYRMSHIGEGVAEFTGVPNGDYLNPMGTIHGGYIATIMDSALACCVQTLCPVGYASTSVDLKINFVRPITPQTGRIFCKANVVHPGRQIATSEGRLTDEAGKLYAHGTQTCSIFKL